MCVAECVCVCEREREIYHLCCLGLSSWFVGGGGGGRRGDIATGLSLYPIMSFLCKNITVVA